MEREAIKQSQAQMASLHGDKGVGQQSGMTSEQANKVDVDSASERAALATVTNDPAASKLHATAGKRQGALGHRTMAAYHAEQAKKGC